MSTQHEQAIEKHGETIAQNLAYHCIAAVKQLMDTLAAAGSVPPTVDLTGASLVVLSIRAAVDLEGVRRKLGQRAAELMLEALDSYYSKGGLVNAAGGFKTWVAAAHKTMENNPDPRDWIRAHCVALLDTRDPEDELFHLALVSSLRAGTPLYAAIAETASKRN